MGIYINYIKRSSVFYIFRLVLGNSLVKNCCCGNESLVFIFIYYLVFVVNLVISNVYFVRKGIIR